MPTTAGKLATELDVTPELVLDACRRAGVSVLGEQTPLDDREAHRVRAVMSAPTPAASTTGSAVTGAVNWGLPPPPGSPPGRPAGKPVPVWAIVGLVFALLLLVIVVMTAFGSRRDPVRTIDEEDLGGVTFGTVATVPPLITTTTLLEDPVSGLAVGECWSNPTRDPASDLVVAHEEIPCAQPHENEVLAIVAHEAPPGAPYPGDDAIRQFADNQCTIRFEGFVGRPIAESALNGLALFPTERMWSGDIRNVICSVYAVDESLLAGSVRGSGR